MRTQELTAVVLTLVASIGTGLVVLGATALSDRPATVEVLARAPERGNWSPQTIELEKGIEVTLVVRNVDVVTHGFYAPALGLSIGALKAGDKHKFTFTPTVEGEFPFYCAVWCSDYHMQMKGTLIVR